MAKRLPAQLINTLIRLLSFIAFLSVPHVCNADDTLAKQPLKVIDFQLRWKHQFQFAGYYAAIEKGYYKEEGLEVRLHEGGPGKTPVQEVLAGRAQYAEANSELLYERLHGQPLVALAAIFQHSASVLLARADAGINTPHDMIGKKIMLMNEQNDADLIAMFLNEGIKPDSISILPSSYDIGDLASGKVAAFNSYLTNEPFFLKQKGVRYVVINPIRYGIDFYCDILFTSEQELKQNPERVKAFRRATLRGWQYAMAHPAELIDILIDKYKVTKSREHLRFEADTMRELILPDLVEIGHMNPGRWQHMADTFAKAGMVDKKYSLDGFIYNPNPSYEAAKLRKIIIIVSSISIISFFVVLLLLAIQRRLKKVIEHSKKAEEALRANQKQLKVIFETSEAGIIMVSPQGIIEFGNQRMAEMFGMTVKELIGSSYMDHLHESEKQIGDVQMRKLIQGEIQSVSLDRHYIRIDGIGFWGHLSGRRLEDQDGSLRALVGVIADTTERKRVEEERGNMEKQLLHAQKLESLGVLAGGIAHDFNNILTSIVGNADLALMRMNPESPAIHNLHKIEHAAARAADLAKQMLAYSGKGQFVIENLDLNRLLKEILHMLEVSISKKVELRFNLTPDLPAVEADASQMQQIIMNLIINASEAIGDHSGVISITTGCMDCDKSFLNGIWLTENISEGQFVCLEISDTGCGMDKETQDRIFDPFFTTKFTGRGLGMAAVLGIVRGHKGAINIYSELSKGTSFKVLLPASGKPVEISNYVSQHDDWRGEGKVLLVDDEETVREIGKEMLQELGFVTITANDGMEALEVFKITPDITFVILDLTMPHMDGEQCFRELQQISHDVKVIISSGFSEHEVAQKFVGKGLAGFLQKPYKLSLLIEAIQKILNTKKSFKQNV